MFKIVSFISLFTFAAGFLATGTLFCIHLKNQYNLTFSMLLGFNRQVYRNSQSLAASGLGADEEEALKAIRAKIAANPNYNPMTDPEASSLIEALIPSEFKEVPNAIARARVAFQDTMEGKDGISDVDSIFSSVPAKDAISSPQSKWFKGGMVDDSGPDEDESEMDSLLAELEKKYPNAKK